MSDKLSMKDTFRFDEPGTIARPGPIGRFSRLVLGAACLWVVWQLATRSGSADLYNPSFWMLAAFGFVLAPYIVNIGFGVKWGAWPRVISAVLILTAAAAGVLATDAFLGITIWAAVAVWMAYIYAHLGVSFVLSAMLATPGCEMRAIPHLLGIVFQQTAREHYCPGFIQHIDRWEHNRGRSTDGSTDPEQSAEDCTANDLLGTTGAQLLAYGVPFVALQIAGNIAGFAIATSVPAIAFILVGIVCLINASLSKRVHCYFMGPWCLIAGTMTALYSQQVIDFGPDSWSLIVNTGLAGAFVIYVTTERIWGKYFGQSPG